MIHSWAPLIWLHSGEQFAPSSVDFFLSYVSLQNRKGRLIDNYLAPDRLPGGPDTAQLHLQTHDKLGTTKIVIYCLICSTNQFKVEQTVGVL